MEKMFINNYQLETMIGAGGFAKVWKALKDGKVFAIKQIPCFEDDLSKSAVMEESITNILEVNCRFLVKYTEIIKRPQDIFFVMDYFPEGDLEKKIKNPDYLVYMRNKKYVMKIIIQLLLAVKTLHEKMILHRDIKASNVFIDSDGNIKLGDYGVGKILTEHERETNTVIGTSAYIAAEIIKGTPYSFPADVWSLGVLFYYLCSGKLPFTAANNIALSMVPRGVYPPLTQDFCDPKLWDIIRSMLHLEPDKRPTVGELLENPYILEFAEALKLKQDFSVAGGSKDAEEKDAKGSGSSDEEDDATPCCLCNQSSRATCSRNHAVCQTHLTEWAKAAVAEKAAAVVCGFEGCGGKFGWEVLRDGLDSILFRKLPAPNLEVFDQQPVEILKSCPPVEVVVLGITNAGKSTLINALLGDFVTSTGKGGSSTTLGFKRIVREKKPRLSVCFWDTQGFELGNVADQLEKTYEFIEKQQEAEVEEARLVVALLCVSEEHPLEEFHSSLYEWLSIRMAVIVVVTKGRGSEPNADHQEQVHIRCPEATAYCRVNSISQFYEQKIPHIGVYWAHGVVELAEEICKAIPIGRKKLRRRDSASPSFSSSSSAAPSLYPFTHTQSVLNKSQPNSPVSVSVFLFGDSGNQQNHREYHRYPRCHRHQTSTSPSAQASERTSPQASPPSSAQASASTSALAYTPASAQTSASTSALAYNPASAQASTSSSVQAYTPTSPSAHVPASALAHTRTSALAYTPTSSLTHTRTSPSAQTPASSLTHTRTSPSAHVPASTLAHTRTSALARKHASASSASPSTPTSANRYTPAHTLTPSATASTPVLTHVIAPATAQASTLQPPTRSPSTSASAWDGEDDNGDDDYYLIAGDILESEALRRTATIAKDMAISTGMNIIPFYGFKDKVTNGFEEILLACADVFRIELPNDLVKRIGTVKEESVSRAGEVTKFIPVLGTILGGMLTYRNVVDAGLAFGRNVAHAMCAIFKRKDDIVNKLEKELKHCSRR